MHEFRNLKAYVIKMHLFQYNLLIDYIYVIQILLGVERFVLIVVWAVEEKFKLRFRLYCR